jgi:DNA ligase (NAD+)
MDITGMGIALVDQLVDTGLVKSFDELYHLKEKDLMTLDRMGAKSAHNIVDSIQRSKEKEFPVVLFALGIPGIGINAAHLLTDQYDKIEQIINVNVEGLSSIKGIGPVIAANINNYFNTSRNRRLIDNLKKTGLKFEHKRAIIQNSRIIGKSFVFTGELESMTREQAQQKIRERGGVVSNSVSDNTGIVVVGSSPGSKYKRALDLGLKIIDESQLIDLLKEE